ncbi:MAG TPA: hypothetical protein PKI19_05555 [Elusimicrobiales bacterium]|nr:hypothetical protein [Elusimicrobiales bacterium]
MTEKIQLFSPGALGTCWYGKYHYLEPWAGCGHNCPYCYARSRAAVSNTLSGLGTAFNKPVALLPEKELLSEISRQANSGKINILKLCRYTDIFTPQFVSSGLALKILDILSASKVSRVIITTKGLPDRKLLNLMSSRKEKFSYNAAARPSGLRKASPLAEFDAALKPLRDRMAAAAELAAAGVQTTIHMDPFVAGIDDETETLETFLDLLRDLKLNRVMFSYLLFSEGIMGTMRAAVAPDALKKIMSDYDFSAGHKVLPGQEDSVSQSLRNEIIRASVEKTAGALDRRGFEFVLCSLKSVRGLDATKYKRNMICDGKFYA